MLSKLKVFISLSINSRNDLIICLYEMRTRQEETKVLQEDREMRKYNDRKENQYRIAPANFVMICIICLSTHIFDSDKIN